MHLRRGICRALQVKGKHVVHLWAVEGGQLHQAFCGRLNINTRRDHCHEICCFSLLPGRARKAEQAQNHFGRRSVTVKLTHQCFHHHHYLQGFGMPHSGFVTRNRWCVRVDAHFCSCLLTLSARNQSRKTPPASAVICSLVTEA
jgi:hypothetical protein